MTRLLIALILSLTSLTANAAGPMSTSKSFDIRHKTLDRIIQSNSSLEISGTFKVWFLLGEPVVNCTASWNNPGISQVVLDSGTRVLAEPGEEDLWKLMLMAQFPNTNKEARRLHNGGGAHLSLFCDAGVVAQNGRGGFNVAGSPSWDKFICATPNKIDTNYTFDVERREEDLCTSVGGEWLPSAAAKQVALAGIKIEDVMVHSFELSNGDTLRRAEKHLWRMKSYEHKEAKAASIMERIRATGDRGTYVANDLQRRFYGAKERDSRLSAEGLRKMDDYIEAAYAELEALQTGARAEVAASWEARDKALVANQLERVAKVDTAIKQRDAEVDAYVAMLDERAKNAPAGPQNPLENYIKPSQSLTAYRGRETQYDYGLKDQSGRFVLEARFKNIRPFGEAKGGYFDLYEVQDNRDLAHDLDLGGVRYGSRKVTWVAGPDGKRLTPRFPASHLARIGLFEASGGMLALLLRAICQSSIPCPRNAWC
ncbi:WG repeat-containing protein [Kordiimonas gwangyangensis]|uniref:WG repeat-containing protein n=1 Tax=Kordiimonas gwangyangensis TaxID=288022 RepID=UPI0004718AE2|nr:WG repeat-containing protein [Kordiimonas gwangyangensis]